jgi:hypothetical protein
MEAAVMALGRAREADRTNDMGACAIDSKISIPTSASKNHGSHCGPPGRGGVPFPAPSSSQGIVAKIAKPTGSKLVKGQAESGEICSVEVDEK